MNVLLRQFYYRVIALTRRLIFFFASGFHTFKNTEHSHLHLFLAATRKVILGSDFILFLDPVVGTDVWLTVSSVKLVDQFLKTRIDTLQAMTPNTTIQPKPGLIKSPRYLVSAYASAYLSSYDVKQTITAMVNF